MTAVKNGETTITDALNRLEDFPFGDLDFAKVDHQRVLRTGFPEVVLAQGKSPEQVAAIAKELVAQSDCLLVTRAEEATFQAVRDQVPGVVYHAMARLITLDLRMNRDPLSGVVVLSAGTADMAVAEEAAITAEIMGSQVQRIQDVGIAGLHRVIHYLPVLHKANVIVVVAGMEGALPSVVAGLVSAPIIAVPTSIGYGASFHGVTALLSMLSTCVAGVSVVNIDNGFGAGYQAAVINGLAHRR